MDFLSLTRIIAVAGLAIGAVGIGLRLRTTLRRSFKKDLSRARGSVYRGVLYAFTLGMAPWEKESTQIHWIAYLRGILFHVAIFTAFGVLLLSPWLTSLPDLLRWLMAAVTAMGAAAGFAGIVMRLSEENLRRLTLPDDYFAIAITSIFVALSAGVLLAPAWLPVFYLVTGFIAIYIPLGKIRHCFYFFFTKFFFGQGFGWRGVIGQPRGKYAE